MARPKKRDWERRTYSIDKEVIEKIDNIVEFESMGSATELIEFLVLNYDAGLNPTSKLQQLIEEKNKIKRELDKVDAEIEQLSQQMKNFKEWEDLKKNRKGQAIRILAKKILHGEIKSAEIISKTWQRQTGVPAPQLLKEAREHIENTGI